MSYDANRMKGLKYDRSRCFIPFILKGNRLWKGTAMETQFGSDVSWIEGTVIPFFSPNRLLATVFLIIFSVILLGTSGVERRMMDEPGVENQQAVVSPLLGPQ